MPLSTSVLTGFDCTRVLFPGEREIDRVTFSCLTHFLLPVTISTLCGFRDGIENLSNFPFSPLPSLPCLPSRVLLTRAFSRLPSMEANAWCFLVAITLITLQLYFGFQRWLWILCTSAIVESDSFRRSSYSLGQEELLQQLGFRDIAIVKSMLVWTLAFESRTKWDLQESLRSTVPLMKN